MKEEAQITSGPVADYEWDFFLAHAGSDLQSATDLYYQLTPPAAVFLDAIRILPGDNWNQVLATAQRSSLISVIIVSPNTKGAYYEQEEIAAAIQMARDDPGTHRVIPVYFNTDQIANKEIPYGLRSKHSLYVPASGDLSVTKEKLLATLEVMKKYEEKRGRVIAAQQVAVDKIVSNRSGAEVLSGINEITKLFRPLLYVLALLLIVSMILLIVSALLSSDLRILLVTIFASLSALLLASILWIMSRSFSYALQIAPGRLNGG